MIPDKESPLRVFFQPARLVVPLFQRPYVWTKKLQWEPLWQDIERLVESLAKDPTATHFLGAFVVQQLPSGLGRMPVWSVIDGQQRLTTLQVLLDALHAQLVERGHAMPAGQIEPLVENPEAFRTGPNERFKVWPTNHDRAGYAAVMGAEPPIDYSKVTPSLLRDAHEYFSQEIARWLESAGPDEGPRAHLLVTAVTRQLELVSIRLDADEDAQAIFETLNARGVPLSAADLIKNFVFQNHGGTEEEVEEAYKDHWAELETPWWIAPVTSGRATHPRSTWFLWHWLRARKLEDFPIRELFGQFKTYVTSGSRNLEELLPQIRAAADSYRAVVEGSQEPTGPLTRAQWFSYRVGTLDSEVMRPLLIWLDEPDQADIPPASRDRMLRALESWFVRRAIVKAPSMGANRFLIDLMVHLSKKPHDVLADELEKYLVSNQTSVAYWPDDSQVTAELRGAPAYNKYRQVRLRMILEAVEDHRRGFPDGAGLAMGPIARGAGTIEHLMPQKWMSNWPPSWSADDASARAAERDKAVHQLGNLTLVTQKLNSGLSNGAWAQKVAYFHSVNDVLITNEVIRDHPDTWDETLIAERTSDLTEEILEIWPVPPGHVNSPEQAQASDAPTEVNLAVLIAEGLLTPGDELRARPAAFAGVRAALGDDGRIYIGDIAYETPSGAAAVVTSAGGFTGDVNGWRFWRVASSGKTLWDVRNDFRLSIGEDGVSEPGEPEAQSEQAEADLVAAEASPGPGGEAP